MAGANINKAYQGGSLEDFNQMIRNIEEDDMQQ